MSGIMKARVKLIAPALIATIAIAGCSSHTTSHGSTPGTLIKKLPRLLDGKCDLTHSGGSLSVSYQYGAVPTVPSGVTMWVDSKTCDELEKPSTAP